GTCSPRCRILSSDSSCFVFFFSSRRRHTRFSRDWSSDVCSSDLHILCSTKHTARSSTKFQRIFSSWLLSVHSIESNYFVYFDRRSEERRVGKECRSGRGTYH